MCVGGVAMALHATGECVKKSMTTPSMSSRDLHAPQSIPTVGRHITLAPEKATGEVNK